MMYPNLPDAISEKIKEEFRNRAIKKRWRLLRWYSTVVFAQLLMTSRDERFRHRDADALGKRGTILRRLYEKACEREQDIQVAQEFEQKRERDESFAERWRNEHRKRLEKYGLPEDTSEAGLREHLELVRREMEESRVATERERATLKQLKDQAEGDPSQEVVAFENYCVKHPESDIGGSFLIGALHRAGRTEEAIYIARRELERVELADLTRPEALYKPAKRHSARSFMLKQSVGRMLLEIGDAAEAIRHWECSIAEEEQKGEDHLEAVFLSHMCMSLGDAYQQNGDISRAREAWKEALHKLPPQSWTAMSDHTTEKEIRKRLEDNPLPND